MYRCCRQPPPAPSAALLCFAGCQPRDWQVHCVHAYWTRVRIQNCDRIAKYRTVAPLYKEIFHSLSPLHYLSLIWPHILVPDWEKNSLILFGLSFSKSWLWKALSSGGGSVGYCTNLSILTLHIVMGLGRKRLCPDISGGTEEIMKNQSGQPVSRVTAKIRTQRISSVASRIPAVVARRFGETYCLHLQFRSSSLSCLPLLA
jgi:hypothetical protein